MVDLIRLYVVKLTRRQQQRLLKNRTQDKMGVWPDSDGELSTVSSIRKKDAIYSQYYLSEHEKNAGPFARLKFAMDYWCALWFWPIDKADELPTREEFLLDMTMILEGMVSAAIGISEQAVNQQSLFPEFDPYHEEIQQLQMTYGTDGNEVDLDMLCSKFERLRLVREIADRQRFFHWELEFADVFEAHGGFDLIVGNPPWIKMEWKEQDVLSDDQPLLAIKRLSAADSRGYREKILSNSKTRSGFLNEYVGMSGIQNYIGANENYPLIKGAANLYKCFLPQAWSFGSVEGVSAFIHPDGVFDDPKGAVLRKRMYPKLRRHYQFINELKLFSDVHHNTVFSLNVYSNNENSSFDSISNLYDPLTIEECYKGDPSLPIPGIKDESGWCVTGHPLRIIKAGSDELRLFAKIFDNEKEWESTRLPVIHCRQYVDVLKRFAEQKLYISDMGNDVFTTEMWHETGAQKDGSIKRDVHEPDTPLQTILSGPHIGVSNPLFKASRRVCRLNSDYDVVDLTAIPDDYLQRCNYSPALPYDEYLNRIPCTSWGNKYTDQYRFLARMMLNLSGERTLIGAIFPKNVTHIHGVFGFAFKDIKRMVCAAGAFSSLPFDFLIKVMGKMNFQYNLASKFPMPSLFEKQIAIRSLRLNCLSEYYSELWEQCWTPDYAQDSWAKSDSRLNNDTYYSLSREWNVDFAFVSDYERRQALIELDVLIAMSLGLSLDQLLLIYRLQFPILAQYEKETWYDAEGRIVFTNNRSLNGVGFSRAEFEGGMKSAPAGAVFCKTVHDDTHCNGPTERIIEYIAPFDKCNRTEDYKSTWSFFSNKYGIGGDKL